MQYKLGKLPAIHDPRTLMLADYLDRASLPRVPAAHPWSRAVSSWPMMGNDVLGDCAIAAPGHLDQMWTTYTRATPFVATDAQIIAAYSACSGYNPAAVQPDGSNPTDVGCNLLNVLNYCRKVGVAGRPIAAFAGIQPANTKLIATAIFLFGGIDVGVQLPASAQSQIANGKWWTVTSGPEAEPGSWGGHSVPIVDYDTKTLTCVTWGQLQVMTWQWFLKYCDEAFALLSMDWIASGKISPSGFDFASLQGDLRLVA